MGNLRWIEIENPRADRPIQTWSSNLACSSWLRRFCKMEKRKNMSPGTLNFYRMKPKFFMDYMGHAGLQVLRRYLKQDDIAPSHWMGSPVENNKT